MARPQKPKARYLGLSMGDKHIATLDKLCTINGRSRRDIVELLIDRAMQDYKEDKDERISP